MKKLRKGDDVIVLSGKDKGKRGAIIKVNSDDYVVVQGVNLVKKHQKPNPSSGAQGGIIDKEMPIIIFLQKKLIVLVLRLMKTKKRFEFINHLVK